MYHSKTRNAAIDITRYLCAVLVVVLHTTPWDKQSFGICLRNYLAYCAVPWFFCVSGFYCGKTLAAGGNSARQLKKLVVTYLLWSIPYLIINNKVWFNNGQSLTEIVIRNAKDLLIFGSYYHFWYFPAVIYASITTVFLYRIRNNALIVFIISSVLMALGCLTTSYSSLIGLKIEDVMGEWGKPFRRVVLEAVPYYAIGMLIASHERALKINRKYVIAGGLALVYTAEKLFLQYHGVKESILTFSMWPLVGYAVWMLSTYSGGQITIADYARSTSNFMYFTHPLLILCLERVSSIFFRVSLSNERIFFCTVFILTLCGAALHHTGMDKKLLL